MMTYCTAGKQTDVIPCMQDVASDDVLPAVHQADIMLCMQYVTSDDVKPCMQDTVNATSVMFNYGE